ncbi:MAG: ATP synthase F0 subunit B [Desulfobacteraceae bacterium]|nr:ATP synthase F0 subunit B [Desulfobacteraceae bacterium]
MGSALNKTIKILCLLLPGIAVVLLLTHTVAFAGEGSPEWRPIYDTVMRWVNFFILVFLIYRYGRQPFKNFLAGRKQEVSREIDHLEERKKEVENQIAETQRQIEQSGEQFEKIKIRIIEEGKRKRQQIIDQAREQSAKLLEMEKKKAANRIINARQQLLAETVDKAGELALSRFPEELTEEDQRNLLSLYIDKVKRMSG